MGNNQRDWCKVKSVTAASIKSNQLKILKMEPNRMVFRFQMAPNAHVYEVIRKLDNIINCETKTDNRYNQKLLRKRVFDNLKFAHDKLEKVPEEIPEIYRSTIAFDRPYIDKTSNKEVRLDVTMLSWHRGL